MHEMERALDVDLFLEAQEQWAKASPHCLVIFYKMFLHAESKGQKEAEQIVHRGCQWYMPQLDPEAGIPLLWRSEKEKGNPGDPLFTSG